MTEAIFVRIKWYMALDLQLPAVSLSRNNPEQVVNTLMWMCLCHYKTL